MPDDYPLRATLAVRTYELDSFGHVNNAVYLNYLEEARSQFFTQMGFTFADLAAHGVQLVIVEATLRFLRPARSGVRVAIAGRFRDVRQASAWIDYVLTDAATGDVLCIAATKGAFVNAESGKPCRAPDAFRTAFAAHT